MQYGTFRALVAMLGHAAATVQTGAFRDALHHRIHLAIGIASGVAEDEIVRPGLLAFLPLRQTLHQNMRQGHDTLLPILRSEVPFLLGRDAHQIVLGIEIKIFAVANLLVAEAGAEDELEHVGLVFGRNLEHGGYLFRLIDRPDGIDEAGQSPFRAASRGHAA